MDKIDNLNFVTKTESLVKPKDVTPISFLGDFNKLLSKKNQDKVMQKGSLQIPYMGFIVDPYCLFLAFEINDIKKAQSYLPKGYEIAETTIFEGETKKPILIVSGFSARTSAFIGMRLEFYIIARNVESGLVSWIIADYETNTNSHDPKNGFCGYTSDTAIFTTTPYGELITKFIGKEKREFSLVTDIKSGTMKNLDQELWVEGNLSIDYGGFIKDDSSENFSLIFDPLLMKEAIKLPLDNINIESNTFFNDIINPKKPITAALFPYSQHFIIKQDLKKHELTQESQLVPLIKRFISTKNFKTMSGNDLKKSILKGMIITSLMNISLIIFLIFRILQK